MGGNDVGTVVPGLGSIWHILLLDRKTYLLRYNESMAHRLLGDAKSGNFDVDYVIIYRFADTSMYPDNRLEPVTDLLC